KYNPKRGVQRNNLRRRYLLKNASNRDGARCWRDSKSFKHVRFGRCLIIRAEARPIIRQSKEACGNSPNGIGRERNNSYRRVFKYIRQINRKKYILQHQKEL